MTTRYPKIERGFYHLTAHGWQRQDVQPFPDDRLETWAYELARQADDAKERVCLTRTWIRPGMSADGMQAFHTLFGQPFLPSVDRNITLECQV